MKKVSLILSSSKRSETYYKEIKNSNIIISKLIFYGNKPKYFRREDLKKSIFFQKNLSALEFLNLFLS